MNILWHMPTLLSHGCGLSIRARHLADQLVKLGHSVCFAVDGNKTDLSHGCGRASLIRLAADNASSIHWTFQSHSRARIAKRLLAQLSVDHDLFVSCQPEMISAYAATHPERPNVFVCGGTNLLHDAAEQADQKSSSIITRGAYAIDRILRRRAEGNGFQAAGAVVFDSNQTRELVIQHYQIDARRAVTIHGGVDPEAFRPATSAERAVARRALKVADNESLIVWTGRFAPEKNLSLLLDALAGLGHSNFKCLLVGDGPMRGELENRVRELGLSERVTFAGSQVDVLSYLHAADAFVFPSRGESFGCALAEAMACGLPCIALKPDGQIIRNASAELIEHGCSGLLVFRPNAKSLAAAIKTVINDSDLRRSLGCGARERVVDFCSWESAGRKLDKLIRELIGVGVPSGANRQVTRSRPIVGTGA